MKLMSNLKYFLLIMPVLAYAWDSDRESDEDRRDSQFENTRSCDGGYDWENFDRSRDRDDHQSCDECRGTIPTHDDSKD